MEHPWMAATLRRLLKPRVRNSVPVVAVAFLVVATEGARGDVLACYGVGNTTIFGRVAYVSSANPVGWYGGVGAVRSEFDAGDQTSTSASVSAGATFEIGSGVVMGIGAVYQQFEAESDWGDFKGSDAGIDTWLRPGGSWGRLVFGLRATRESGVAGSIGWMF